MDNKRPLIAHLCLFCSGAFWGLMAPVGKDAMLHPVYQTSCRPRCPVAQRLQAGRTAILFRTDCTLS